MLVLGRIVANSFSIMSLQFHDFDGFCSLDIRAFDVFEPHT